MSDTMPQYPIYVISKGRAKVCYTANFLIKDKVPFWLVVEPQELEDYAARYPREIILTLPFSNLGLGGIPARNWVWEHSKEQGHEWHWILDDNIKRVYRMHKGKRIRVTSSVAFRAIEDFTMRYENIGISGMNYSAFVGLASALPTGIPPIYINNHVYSCLFIRNELPFRWRGRYNEDTDLCLQTLSKGWCTVLFNAFCIDKMATMTMKGGNSDQLYQGDGRLKMARSLEEAWPYVVETKRRFGRPQHVVNNAWRKFDTPLKRRSDIDWDNLKPNNYGMTLTQVSDTIKSEEVANLLKEENK